MSKETLSNWQQQSAALLNVLEGKEHELGRIRRLQESNKQVLDAKEHQRSLESQLSTAQSEHSKAEASHQRATSALSHSLTENRSLNDELQTQNKFFAFITDLSNKYREFEGITVNPAIIMTKKLSAVELAHTDVLKVTCKEQCPEAFDLALSKITNINIQDLDGRTILMHAIINGFYHGVDKLLQKGADVNLLDNQGANALLYCAQNPHIKYVKQITERTTDINYKATMFGGGTVLHSLIENSRKIIFASELNNELKQYNQNHYSVNSFIIDEDFTITGLSGERKGDGYTVNQEKTWYIIKFLVSNGANINMQNDQGLTPLFLACAHKLKYLSKQLMDHCPIEWDLIDNFGYNTLQWVLELRDKNLVKQVIDKTDSINHQDRSGNTALFWSAKYLLPDIVDLLFNTYDANDLPNKNGLTAWDIATLNAQHCLIDVLIVRKGIKKEYVELWCAAKKGDISVVERLLNDGIDPNLTIDNYNNTTPLIQAVVNKHVPVIQSLLKHNANINKADKEEASPLYYSLGYGGQTVDLTVVSLLLAQGADVNQPMADGDTPLHMASYQANVSAMKILLNNGATVAIKNNQNKTPLDVLIEKQGLKQDSKLESIKYLILNSTFPLPNNTVDLARNCCTDAVLWLEHPENLPSITEFETSIGAFQNC